MNQRVIIIRGAPASGKTTIAKSYRNYEKKVVWLKVDSFKDFFAEDASDALTYVNGAAIATLRFLLEQGFSVVIDGIFQDVTAINEIVNLVNQRNIPIKVFELEVSLDTLKKRDLIREGVLQGLRKPLGEETIEKIYNNLNNNSFPNSIKLNTENNNLEVCKTIIEKYFV